MVMKINECTALSAVSSADYELTIVVDAGQPARPFIFSVVDESGIVAIQPPRAFLDLLNPRSPTPRGLYEAVGVFHTERWASKKARQVFCTSISTAETDSYFANVTDEATGQSEVLQFNVTGDKGTPTLSLPAQVVSMGRASAVPSSVSKAIRAFHGGRTFEV